jgi:WD40 repeat protein
MESDTTPPTLRPCPANASVQEEFGWISEWLRHHQLFTTLDALLDEGMQLLDLNVAKIVEPPVSLPSIQREQPLTPVISSPASILSVKFHPAENWLATGHADKTVRVHMYKKGNDEQPWESSQMMTLPIHQGGVVSTEFHPTIPNRLLTSCLDNSWAVVDLFPEQEQSYHVLQQTRDHTKYVIRAKWHPTRTDLFVTAGYDHICTLWHRESESQPWSKQHSWHFAGNVEAVEFSPDGEQLVIASRGVPYLTYVNLVSMCQTQVCVNALGDDFVSFNVLDLAVHDKHVIACTDKSRVIMYKLGTPFQVRNFFGLENDEYSTPRVQLDQSGHLYATSQSKQICVFDVASEKLVHELRGHKNIVRDIHVHKSRGLLASCSYDKTVKLWC